jgi:hypothetical protein
MSVRFVALLAAALCLLTGYVTPVAEAQTPPAPPATPVVLPTLPPNQPLNPYVKIGIDLLTNMLRQEAANARNNASGQVSYFKRFEMQVQTGSNSYRDVHLHQGTVINPRGATLAPGQRVAVGGVGQPDGSIDANVITIQQ